MKNTMILFITIFIFSGCATKAPVSDKVANLQCSKEKLPGGCLTTVASKCFNYSCRLIKQGCETQLTCDEIKQEMAVLECSDFHPHCVFDDKKIGNPDGFTPQDVLMLEALKNLKIYQ